MRDPNRIPKILDVLGQIWMYCPDLRLGQIIVNAMPHMGNDYDFSYFFHYEDDELLKNLEDFLALCQQRKQPRT